MTSDITSEMTNKLTMRILLIYKTNITAEQYKKCTTTTKELSAFTKTYKLYLTCYILEKPYIMDTLSACVP